MISPDILQQRYSKWQELLSRNEGETLKKIICIDVNTIRSNKRKEVRPSHIVSAWNREEYRLTDQLSDDIYDIYTVSNLSPGMGLAQPFLDRGH